VLHQERINLSPIGRSIRKYLILFSVYGTWVRTTNGQLPHDATHFYDEFGSFYVVKATIALELRCGHDYYSRYRRYLSLPAKLRGTQAVVSYSGHTYSTSDYEVSLCTNISVETKVREGFNEISP